MSTISKQFSFFILISTNSDIHRRCRRLPIPSCKNCRVHWPLMPPPPRSCRWTHSCRRRDSRCLAGTSCRRRVSGWSRRRQPGHSHWPPPRWWRDHSPPHPGTGSTPGHWGLGHNWHDCSHGHSAEENQRGSNFSRSLQSSWCHEGSRCYWRRDKCAEWHLIQKRGVMLWWREMILIYGIPEVITLSPLHMMISDDSSLARAKAGSQFMIEQSPLDCLIVNSTPQTLSRAPPATRQGSAPIGAWVTNDASGAGPCSLWFDWLLFSISEGN